MKLVALSGIDPYYGVQVDSYFNTVISPLI